MFTAMQIYDNIETMRIVRNISQRQLLADCGLSKSFMDNLKKGSMPSVDKIKALCRQLTKSLLLQISSDAPLIRL